MQKILTLYVHPQGQLQFEITNEDKKRFELHRAIEEMKRLDEILYKATYKERETKRQRKELQAKLWEDLMVRPAV